MVVSVRNKVCFLASKSDGGQLLLLSGCAPNVLESAKESFLSHRFSFRKIVHMGPKLSFCPTLFDVAHMNEQETYGFRFTQRQSQVGSFTEFRLRSTYLRFRSNSKTCQWVTVQVLLKGTHWFFNRVPLFGLPVVVFSTFVRSGNRNNLCASNMCSYVQAETASLASPAMPGSLDIVSKNLAAANC